MALIIDNKIVENSIENILQNLKQQVSVLGLRKLKSIEYSQTEAKVTCPIHKGGEENRPSCYIALTDKGDVKAGTVHCFTCGYRADIVSFVADCLNVSRANAKQWILGFCNYSLVENKREVPSLKIDNKFSDNYDELPVITQKELQGYEYIHPYMFKRKLNDEIIRKFDVGYDPLTNSLTFPVYVNGKCLFVAKRRVDRKYFTLPKIEPKPIYGLDYITDKEFIVCESVINALTCWVYGRQAVALFGLGSEYQIEILKQVPQRKIVIGFDGDVYGDKASYRLANALRGFKIVSKLVLPYGKDINDLSYEEFKNLREIFL